MTNAYVLTGTLTDPQTVRLSEPLPVGAGEVRVTIEMAAPPMPKPHFLSVLEQIWKEQEARGHNPPTAEEVAERIRDARKGWDD